MKTSDQDSIIEQCKRAFRLNQRPSKVPREFLGAFKQGHRKNMREHIDDDYSYTLLRDWVLDRNAKALEALQYITKFNNEYYRGVLPPDGSTLHAASQFKELRHDKYACEQDIISIDKSIKSIEHLSSFGDSGELALNSNRDLSTHEDLLIEIIDSALSRK